MRPSNLDTCDANKCTRKAEVIARDGRRFCKRHADRLPRSMRRAPRVPKALTEE
jgi:hypothetical protein